MTWRIIIIVNLIILSAFFSACETALTGANRIRLKHRAENKSDRKSDLKSATAAKKALRLIGKYDRMLATLLIGNNTVNLVAASLATMLAVHYAETSGHSEAAVVAIVTSVITLTLIVMGDILPKTLAREHADGFVTATSGIMSVLMALLSPLSAVMLLLQRGLSKVFRKSGKEVSVTEEELLHIIDEIEEQGVLEKQEGHLVRSALEFDETTLEEILTPRVDMTAVSISDTVERVRNVFFEEGYSRLPVYDGSPDRVVGVISNKTFMKWMLGRDSWDYSELKISGVFKEVVQDVLQLFSLMKLSDALKTMQKQHAHLAVVLDQHGGTAGIVTLEDILEELVGEIWDEGDEETSSVRVLGDKVFEVGSELSINDFNRFLANRGCEVEISSDKNTVGGWVFEVFDKIPEVGEEKELPMLKLTVLTMENRRIGRVKVQILQT